MIATRRRSPRWPMLCPACNVGQRGHCDCPQPAEACTELGANTDSPGRIWPLVACLAILALYASVGDLPADDPIAAMAALPGDGFPPELLTIVAPEPAASEAHP